MDVSCKIILFSIAILILNENVESKKVDLRDFFQRRQFKEQRRARRAITPAQTAKEKDTNKLVLAALYGGLGQGIPSSTNFDYANGLNPKIQSAGGYGLPSGIYSYAFDPKTGMPFMCDPTKTPPGGGTSQTAGVAANPASATTPATPKKPTADEPSANVPSENELSASAPSPDIHTKNTNTNEVLKAVTEPEGTNAVGTNELPEHRLSPVERTPLLHKAQNDASPTSDSKPTFPPANEKTTPSSGNDNDIMTSSSPSNKLNDGVTPTPSKDESTPTASSKGVHVKLGPPLYVTEPKTNSQSSVQSKVTNQRLTPLIDNYHKDLQHSGGVKMILKRSNVLKKYIQRKKADKKNEIKIQLPEIPACPDMKNYHWPWNCLEKGKTVKKECIQNYGGTFSYQGATYPYEDYGRAYDYDAEAENGNYFVQ